MKPSSVPHGPDSYYPQAQLHDVPRSAFLVWAILVALAVSALVFPKLPDTLGLSQEAGGGGNGAWLGSMAS